MTANSDPAFSHLTIASLVRAWRRGWTLFSRSRQLSVTYAMIFSLIGVVILVGIERASYAPLIVPLGGGLLLVGPSLLCGFFALADRVARGENSSMADIVSGCTRASLAMFAVALFSTALFIVWVFDVAMLYGLAVGRVPMLPGMLIPPADDVVSFSIWSALLALLLPLAMFAVALFSTALFIVWVFDVAMLYGLAVGRVPMLPGMLISPADDLVSFSIWSALLALLLPLAIFAISAFSVPLLYYRRASLWPALRLSVAAVLSNLAVSALWTLWLSLCLIASIVIFPLILLTFPVLAFASHSLYRELFPG